MLSSYSVNNLVRTAESLLDLSKKLSSEIAHLHEHLQWRPDFVEKVIRLALRERLVEDRAGYLQLTDEGRQLARRMIVSS